MVTVVPILHTTTLSAGEVCCRSQAPQASGREPQKHGFLRQTCRINLFSILFGSASHPANMHSWKAGRPSSNLPSLKTQSQQFFISSWFLLHGNMGPTSKNATTNRLGDHKLKNLVKASLWQAWVAWIEGGQLILGTENLQWKIIRIHHWFTTVWRCSSWIVTPN